jgi:RNA-directed DNA polymerase
MPPGPRIERHESVGSEKVVHRGTAERGTTEARREGRRGVLAAQLYRGSGDSQPEATPWREVKTERGGRVMEPMMGKTTETSCSESVLTKQQRIAKLAREMPGVVLTTLAHHIDIDWLREAYRRTRKDAAPGVDGQRAEEYAADLDANLGRLLARAKDGESYRAPPVRRVHIPKGRGRQTRPIGVPTFEDKVLQRAVVMVLEAVYEQDFLECSYGFRPGRGPHDALQALWQQAMMMGGGWLLEADIESFFDSVDRRRLQQVLRTRVRDGVLLRLIGKWLRAGVMEDGCVYHPETGTPQGGVISPLLEHRTV